MNPEQIKSGVRWFITGIGGSLIGWAVAKWNLSPQITTFLTSETFIGLAASAAGLVWGMVTHTNANTVVAASKVASVTEVGIADPALAKEVKEKTADVDVRVVTKQP